MTDHDQRFKVLIEEFFSEFIELFFPTWWERFDFTRVEWLKQDIFTDPPQGERRALDLVAKLPTKQSALGQRPDEADSWLALVHIEVESRDSVQPLRSRMHDTYEHLRRNHHLPVLPIGLYLRVGLDGVGIDVYEEHFWEFRTIQFRYLYVGLPALDGVEYMSRDNYLGFALAALMRITDERKAWLRAEARKRIMESSENLYRKYLLHECVEAYVQLNEAQEREYQQLKETDPYKETDSMAVTVFEKRLEQEMQSALTVFEKRLEQEMQSALTVFEKRLEQEFRDALVMQLEARFGALSPHVQQRIESLPIERIRELMRAFAKAQTLEEMGLEP